MDTEVFDEQISEDLYPKDRDAHDTLVRRVNEMFNSAEEARRPLEDRWIRYYRMFRSYIERKQGNWRSKVYMPHAFYVIETILPKLTAALPHFLSNPVGGEDVMGASNMEELLDWSAKRSDLDEQLLISNADTLIYGTGILKTKHARFPGVKIDRVPKMKTIQIPQSEAVPDLNGMSIMAGLDGGQLMSESSVPYQVPTGQFETKRSTFTLYEGPTADACDPFNIWPAGEATSVSDARFIIHRVYRDRDYIEKKIKSGEFKLPEHFQHLDEAFDTTGDPQAMRLSEIGLEGGRRSDPTRRVVELLECWTEDRQMILANRRVILLYRHNPFAHGEKPFIRQVDHLVPHEFWGIGELEVLEGLQDVLNATVNQRIDNTRLLLNAMFMVDTEVVKDLRDLQMRPGGVIRVKGAQGRPLQEFVQQLVLSDVTGGAFAEVAELERTIEKVSGVSAYQTGTDSPDLNATATGVALISEQGNTRFSHKVRLAELTGYRHLARHYGTILQQFMPESQVLRIQGPDGTLTFKSLTPDDIQGAFDYDIEAESITVTESVKKDQALSLFQMFANNPYVNQLALIEDALRAFGHKDTDRYMAQPQMPAAPSQEAAALDPALQGLGMPPVEAPPPAAPPPDQGAPAYV